MKIRSDYVTNSSSSSFILSFKNEDSIYDTLKEQFPTNIKTGWSYGDSGYLCQLLNEIEEANRLTHDDVKEIIEYENWNIRCELEEILEKNMSYLEISNFFETDEGQKMIDDAYKEKIDRIMKDIGEDQVIVEIDHGDSGDGEDGVLENEILPNLECTRAIFSHH